MKIQKQHQQQQQEKNIHTHTPIPTSVTEQDSNDIAYILEHRCRDEFETYKQCIQDVFMKKQNDYKRRKQGLTPLYDDKMNRIDGEHEREREREREMEDGDVNTSSSSTNKEDNMNGR